MHMDKLSSGLFRENKLMENPNRSKKKQLENGFKWLLRIEF